MLSCVLNVERHCNCKHILRCVFNIEWDFKHIFGWVLIIEWDFNLWWVSFGLNLTLAVNLMWNIEWSPTWFRALFLGSSAEIVLGVVLHYALYVYLVVFSRPEKTRSVGYHQPVGPCAEIVPVQTPFGHVRLFVQTPFGHMRLFVQTRETFCSDTLRTRETSFVQTPFGHPSDTWD